MWVLCSTTVRGVHARSGRLRLLVSALGDGVVIGEEGATEATAAADDARSNKGSHIDVVAISPLAIGARSAIAVALLVFTAMDKLTLFVSTAYIEYTFTLLTNA